MEGKSSIYKEVLSIVRVPLIGVGLLWVLHLLTEIFNIQRIYLGLYPRRIEGLRGILTSPLFHSDWGHLFNNSLPLLVTGSIIFYFYRKVSLPVITIIYFLTGIAVWLFAHKGYHIGASGVAYGMVSFVFFSGIFRRNIESIIMALIVVILYSGMIAGIFPDEPGISWESHLFGAISGLFTAVLYSGVDRKEEEIEVVEKKEYFLPRDVFEKTIMEREIEKRNSTDHFT